MCVAGVLFVRLAGFYISAGQRLFCERGSKIVHTWGTGTCSLNMRRGAARPQTSHYPEGVLVERKLVTW
jgi:hypothetical protein